MKNRLVSDTIKKKSSTPFGRIIVLTGARQTGKTTLAKRIFPDYPYLSIDDPVMVEEYKKLSAQEWKALYPVAILDEIQKEPGLVESIKSVYDQFQDTKYILLGSSQILLLKKIRESLAGRCHIIELYPLTLPELLTGNWDEKVQLSYFQKLLLNKKEKLYSFLLDNRHPQKKNVFSSYLQYGAYPALSGPQISDDDKWDWLRNYVRTYLERDIRDLVELRQLEPFTKVQKIMALNTAQMVNYSRIASEAGVSSKTVQRFLEYMVISYQTLVLQPWSRNPKKKLVKSPKIHYLDVGVLKAILKKRDKLNGHEFESAIIAEIFKQAKSINVDLSFYHLRTSDGREVDLLIETEDGYIAIEIKQSEKVRPVDARHLKGIEDILDKPVLHKFVLSNDLSLQQFDDEIISVPAVQFLT